MKILRIIEVAIIFIGVLYIFAISIQLNQMKKNVKKLKNKNRRSVSMSKIINELLGKKCKVTYQDGVSSEVCQILDVDEEWVKLKADTKKEKDCIKIIRIDTIDNVEIIEN